MKARVTRIVCPSCEGTGKFRVTGTIVCLWCHGMKRVPTAVALRYANNQFAFAEGGYVCGEHDLDTAQEMKEKAERVFALAQQTPPWKRVGRVSV